MKLNHIDVGMNKLRGKFGNLQITLNEHNMGGAPTLLTVRDALANEDSVFNKGWPTEDQRVRAINSNSMWTLRHWRDGTETVLRFSAIKTLIWVVVHGTIYEPPSSKDDVEDMV